MVRMMKAAQDGRNERSLGIEGGGTRSSVVVCSPDGQITDRATYGPGNLQHLDDAALGSLLGDIKDTFGAVDSVGIGLAGLRTDEDRARVASALDSAWPEARRYITDDLEPILAGVPSPTKGPYARILLISGTGSSCLGQHSGGQSIKVGGWGRVLGDESGAYGIGLAGLQALIRDFDRRGKVSPLLRQVLQDLGLSHPDELNSWSAHASKSAVASVALPIFSAWKRRHRLATEIVEAAVARLAEDARSCWARLGRPSVVQILLAGGCFRHQIPFATALESALMASWPRCQVVRADSVGAEGAARLGRERGTRPPLGGSTDAIGAEILPVRMALSPTEERNPRSTQLDRLSIRRGIELMIQEDAAIPAAIRGASRSIERVVRWAAEALAGGGRLIYLGAGTSGRLGVLDASECPPTFRSDPDQVQGIMAGGRDALWRSVEGAEDSVATGVAEVIRLDIGPGDLLVGIAASGRTPFVWGGLVAAKKRGAQTALLCFNPHLKFATGTKPDAVICPETGPEVLTGSTRLKAGTATKMVLNMISTLAMVRLGKVIQNLMVDVNPSNEKLRERAVRILVTLTGQSETAVLEALNREQWVVKKAHQRLERTDRKAGKRS